MKKMFCLLFSLSLLVFGCGGDDGGGTGGGETTPTLTAASGIGSPSMDNPNDPIWSSATSQNYALAGANAPKNNPSISASVADSITVSAIVTNDSLFVKCVWSDADNSVWKDYFAVVDDVPPILFDWSGFITDEDHLFVMFDGGTEFGWDVWNWRSYTTAAGGLAEGFVFNNDLLTQDEGGAMLAIPNNSDFFDEPTFIPNDTSSFTGHIFYFDSKMYITDTTVNGTVARMTEGWTVGQRIPGYMIDSTLQNDTPLSENRRASRFDIRSTSEYNATSGQYTVVLGRALTTSFADDIDLGTKANITLKVGVFNNVTAYDNSEFTLGSGSKGFTVNINLVLP